MWVVKMPSSVGMHHPCYLTCDSGGRSDASAMFFGSREAAGTFLVHAANNVIAFRAPETYSKGFKDRFLLAHPAPLEMENALREREGRSPLIGL